MSIKHRHVQITYAMFSIKHRDVQIEYAIFSINYTRLQITNAIIHSFPSYLKFEMQSQEFGELIQGFDGYA